MGDIRLSHLCCRKLKSSGMLHCVIGSSWSTWTWRWRHCNPSKCQELLTQWHSIMFQNNWLFNNMWVWELTCFLSMVIFRNWIPAVWAQLTCITWMVHVCRLLNSSHCWLHEWIPCELNTSYETNFCITIYKYCRYMNAGKCFRTYYFYSLQNFAVKMLKFVCVIQT